MINMRATAALTHDDWPDRELSQFKKAARARLWLWQFRPLPFLQSVTHSSRPPPPVI